MVGYEPIDQIIVSMAREMKDYETCYTGVAIPSAVIAILILLSPLLFGLKNISL